MNQCKEFKYQCVYTYNWMLSALNRTSPFVTEDNYYGFEKGLMFFKQDVGFKVCGENRMSIRCKQTSKNCYQLLQEFNRNWNVISCRSFGEAIIEINNRCKTDNPKQYMDTDYTCNPTKRD